MKKELAFETISRIYYEQMKLISFEKLKIHMMQINEKG